MTLHDISQVSFLLLLLLCGGAVGIAIREYDKIRRHGDD